MNNKDIFDICLAKKLSGGSPAPTPTYEDKTVTPDFSNGDVVVEPDEGYDALSSVTIEKDADLVAGNIKKDVNVFGITGTLEGGGGSYNVEYAFADENMPTLESAGLVSVKFPNTITSIPSYYFSGYYDLVTVYIPNSVETIGDNCFSECSSLETVTFEESSNLSTIPYSCFSSCTSLTSINIPNGVGTVGDNCFYSCTSLTTITIPSSVGSLGTYCFSGCALLETVTFEESSNLTQIPASCFYECASLTSINIPNSVETLDSDCFYSCTSLTSVNIPSSVVTLEFGCFRYCTSLTTVILRANQVVDISNGSVFDDTQFNPQESGGTFYVPQALISDYQNDQYWSDLLTGNPNNQILAIEGSIYE